MCYSLLIPGINPPGIIFSHIIKEIMTAYFLHVYTEKVEGLGFFFLKLKLFKMCPNISKPLFKACRILGSKCLSKVQKRTD